MRVFLTFLLGCLAAWSAGATSLEDLVRPEAKWIAELPIYSRSQKASDDPRDPELMRNEQNPKLSFFATSELKSLVPQRYRLGQDSQVQELVDQISLRLFGSNKIRQAFCFLGTDTHKDFSHYLGVSESLAKDLKRKCSDQKVSERERKLLGIMKLQMFEGDQTLQKPKRFGLVLSLSDLPAFEGFTTRDGVTLVVLHENEVSVEVLLRVWIHELAITFDRLGGLAPRFTTEWTAGLGEALGLSREKAQKITATGDPRALSCALRDPAVRYALAAERAFRFEDDVLRDMGLLGKSPPLSYRGLSCEQAIGRRAVQISPLAPVLTTEISWQSFYEECGGVDLLRDAERSKTLVSRIKLVANTQVQLQAGSEAKDLCDIVLEPLVGARRPENVRHGGPRPRVGGWE